MAIGCAENYSALIARQVGGAEGTGQGTTPVVVGEVVEITSLEFNRILSGTSTARVEFTRCPTNCSFMSAPVKPWAYELWLYRDGILVWCGPIVITKESRVSETFELIAWDITGWTTRRRIGTNYTLTNNATSIAINLAQEFFDGTPGRPDPGLLDYVNFLGFASTTITVEYDGFQYTVAQKWADLVNAGFSYTTMGRYTFVWGETAPNLDSPFVIDATEIMGEMELVQDGTDFATRVVGMGEGVRFSAGPFPVDAAYYGGVDWPTVRYQGITDDPQIQALTLQLFSQKRDLSPTLVIPSGSSLTSNTEIQSTGYTIDYTTQIAIPELMCGLRYDVQVPAEQFCQPGRYPMRLDEMKVTWTPEGQEKIAVSFGTLGIPEDD
jgi:hypothetical protein